VASRNGSVGGGAMMGAKTGISSFSGGGSELGTSFPLAAYQAAPLLDLPLKRGMARAIRWLGNENAEEKQKGPCEVKCRTL
jgi:hypothetical protein